MGNTTKVYMNDYGNPLKIEDPNNYYIEKKYDTDFNVIKYTDQANKNHTYTYHNYTEGSKYKTYGRINKTDDPLHNETFHSWSFLNDEANYIAYLSKVTHKNEYSTEYTYDNYYNLATITDANNSMSARYYDTYGNMISYHDFRGFVTNYSYDRYANLLNITDPGGNVTRNSYDQKNRLKNITDARGFVTTYEYDDLDRITKITDALGNSTQYIYDEGSEGVYSTGVYGGCGGGYSVGGHTPIAIIDVNGQRTNLTLNYTIKRIEKIEESAGCGCSEKIFKYDNNGNLIEFIDAKGNKTTYEYDSLNRLIKETDARGNITRYTYDPNGNLGAVTNRRGYTTVYMYDTLNRKTREIDATGNITYYTYDIEGNLKTVKNARGYTTTYYYDPLNRLKQINDASNYNTYYTYDANGNKIAETDPNGNSITYEYDALNRLIKVKDALNHETKYDYDSVGNKLNITDANGNITKYAYDALNRLITGTDANNNVTTYSYDASGHLLNITDANGHKTRQEYDSLYRLKKIIYPSGNYTEYSYDGLGNRNERKDAKGLSTYYEYDEINRLVQIKYPDNSTIIYLYDQEGNPTKVINNAGFGETTYFIYDSVNRPISVKVDYGTFDKYVNYTYDEVGNRKTMTDPEGNITYYYYDTMDRLINITAPGHNPILFIYDNAGRRTRQDYPNGAYTTYSYNNANRITTIWHKKSGGASIAIYNYTYDNVSNILNFTENDANYTIYTYDNVYRLTNVSYSDGNWTAYTYDGVGNRLTLKNRTTTIIDTYDEDNRILTTGSITYKHDENGNLINKTDGNDTTLYEYDYENRLTKATMPGSLGSISYQYAADERRMNRSVSGGVNDGDLTLYLYDSWATLMELNSTGYKMAYYSGESRCSPISMDRVGSSLHYLHKDLQNSVRFLTDTNADTVATYNYDPFGNFDATGNVNNPYRYSGVTWDVNSKLHFHRTTYYDSTIGITISGNIFNPLDLNTEVMRYTSDIIFTEANNVVMVVDEEVPIPASFLPGFNCWLQVYNAIGYIVSSDPTGQTPGDWHSFWGVLSTGLRCEGLSPSVYAMGSEGLLEWDTYTIDYEAVDYEKYGDFRYENNMSPYRVESETHYIMSLWAQFDGKVENTGTHTVILSVTGGNNPGNSFTYTSKTSMMLGWEPWVVVVGY
jgi:YD repeat-containing protein